MTDATEQDSPSAEPCGEGRPLSRVQTDMFCHGCGANLYNRPVWRTNETQLLVVRCGRCGKISSANEVLPYRRVWRQRLGLVLMLLWLATLGGALLTLVAVELVILHETPRRNYRSHYGPSYGPSRREIGFDWSGTKEELTWAVPTSLIVTFAGGCLLSCAVYHWKMRWHVMAALAVPMIAAALFWLEYSHGRYETWLRTGAMHTIYAITALHMFGGVAGILLGRPVARKVLRVLLPSRSRGFFSFLWRRDGKDVPMGPF